MSLLNISNLTVVYPTRTGKFTAERDVTFSVDPGKNLGIVSESSAGETTISTAITRLIEYPRYIEHDSISPTLRHPSLLLRVPVLQPCH